MVEVQIEGDEVVFRVLGLHKLWTFRSELRIPRAHIVDARHETPESPLLKGWRNVGTWVPGVLTAGSYQVHGQRVFYDVAQWDKVVVIDLADEHFNELVIEVDDPPGVVRLFKGP
jgi:hypothetical protein